MHSKLFITSIHAVLVGVKHQHFEREIMSREDTESQRMKDNNRLPKWNTTLSLLDRMTPQNFIPDTKPHVTLEDGIGMAKRFEHDFS